MSLAAIATAALTVGAMTWSWKAAPTALISTVSPAAIEARSPPLLVMVVALVNAILVDDASARCTRTPDWATPVSWVPG